MKKTATMRRWRTEGSSGRPYPLDLSTKDATVGNRLLLPLMLCVLVISASSIAAAQRGAGMHSAGTSFHGLNHGLNRNHAFSGNAFFGGRHGYPYGSGYPYGLGYPGYASLPFPFLADDFDPSDIYSTGYPVSSAPPPYLMQALQGLVNPAAGSMSSLMTPPPGNHEGSSNEPLMIEFQNGRYVRVNGPVINSDAEPIQFSENSGRAKSAAKAAKPAREEVQPQTVAAASLPPVTLVFRDGHSEEVRDYTIAQGALYARGDYYTDGYWNKKIDLSTLDVPATLQANASRDVNFVLPSSPNEVITRP
jgi:hypothetical protein